MVLLLKATKEVVLINLLRERNHTFDWIHAYLSICIAHQNFVRLQCSFLAIVKVLAIANDCSLVGCQPHWDSAPRFDALLSSCQ